MMRSSSVWSRAYANLEREAMTKNELAFVVALGLIPAAAVPTERQPERQLERSEMTDAQVEADIQKELDEAARVRRELGHLPYAALPPYASGRVKGTIPSPSTSK